ncbi:M1 family metallopeptidase [Seonamhaeicola marinus]|uniref:M1 family metallopeptidase n=1 Tax=Seonamhaeicola marinus TaxID=1912246 RepID=UPI001FE398BC|nr:M1 family metallopeptidase [Seonamhaeicola marinus]
MDFIKSEVKIDLRDLFEKSVHGKVTYEFEILKNVDSIFIDAKNFESIQYTLNDAFTDSLYNGKQLIVKHDFKTNTRHKIDVIFHTKPKKALYFIEFEDSQFGQQIWTQGQGKYTSNWLPSIDDMNDKIEFDLKVTYHSEYQVICNGELENQIVYPDAIEWHYNMEKPMCSYLVALAIGKYDKKVDYSKSGVPLEMYYYPKDSLKFEPTYRYTKQMFDFLEEEIGMPYPWQNYKQVPVKDFLYAGMENTGTTLFADSFVIDSIAFVDKNYVNVNAHELAHQWFGNLVTETSGTHHWLHEGFATYYALLAEKEVFGEDYFYWQLYEYAQEILEQDKAGKSTSLLDPMSSSITFYKKGCWVLHILREKVGDKAFKAAVKNYLEKHQFKNVETNDFISEVEKYSGQDLNNFKENLLISSGDKFLEDVSLLMKYRKIYEKIEIYTLDCPSGVDLLKFQKERNALKIKKLNEKVNRYTKRGLFNDLVKDSLVDRNELYSAGFQSKNIKVRQAIAQNLTEIPAELKKDYESLLEDKSYLTIEAALFNLWRNFPEDRSKYLDKTKGIIGFNDKNVRMLWLTLALITEEYQVEFKKGYFDELTSYTSSKFGFEVRQNAFQYLSQIQACGSTCKENLKQATKHHNWRFNKFAKRLLEQID